MVNIHLRKFWLVILRVLCRKLLNKGEFIVFGKWGGDFGKLIYWFLDGWMDGWDDDSGVRPFGVSLLIAGWDSHRGQSLYQVDPSGSFWAWKASAIGKNMSNGKTFLEKR
jgi:hypothetical protein